MKTVGILTGGGDCPGLNAVIRAVALALHNESGARVTGIERGFAHRNCPMTVPIGLYDSAHQ